MGPLACLLSAVGFGLMAVLAKLAYGDGVALDALLLTRFGMAGLVLVLLAQLQGRFRGLTRRVVVTGLLMGGVGYVAQAGLYLAALTRAETEKTRAAAAEHDRVLAEQAEAQARANTPEGAKATARSMASSQYGWGDDQFSCLESLWTKESGWNYQAYNASSGATGIPQSLPGNKMASAGADWQTNATTQIAWGLQYIASAYGTPCSAWGHSQATDWY